MECLLALDFDGVLCDSRAECLLTGLAAYGRLEPSFPFTSRCIDDVDPALAAGFLAHRHLVRVAAQFVLLFDMLLHGRTVRDDRLLEDQTSVDRERMRRYKHFFYEERGRWVREEPKSWFEHNVVFEDVLRVALKWHAARALAIVSAKDADAILAILAHQGLVLPRSAIFDVMMGEKCAHVRSLRQAHSSIFFIDDNLENLQKVRMQGVTPFMALWGFVPPTAIDLAGAADVATLDLPTFVERFG